ncbi:MAG: biopolymer transporter ExbD [Candidatus Symbiothrix sp.]|jgi:biopolymer transport protein ExbD|nr:biopolymer transporter ExbD [Candidatus Symbiothrix sp.]
MAEVQTSDHGEGGKKNKQKKQHLRVDFTPMVDMNMLLITFFMFCTTLLKPQTMNLNMPSKENDEKTNQTKVRESTAITVILGAENTLYYYEGMPKEDGSDYKNPDFLKETTYTAEGLRAVLLKKNEGTYEAIQELKAQKEREEITDEVFREESKKVQDKAKEAKKAPTIMIKATELSTYKNLVDVLDEMLICNIGAYAIIDISDGDRYLLYEKTKYGEYLTEAQRAQANR